VVLRATKIQHQRSALDVVAGRAVIPAAASGSNNAME